MQRTPETFHEFIKKSRGEKKPDPDASILKELDVEETESGGSRVFHATAKGGGPVEANILYIHGGSFIFDIDPLHWQFIAMLAKKLQARVTVPAYPLAPEHKLPQAYDMLQPLYDQMAAATDGLPFWVFGDSAGGTYTIGLTQRALDAGKPTATRLVPISPCVDGTMTNPDLFVTAIEKDPWLALPGVSETLRLVLGDLKRDDHRISPIYGTLKGLPPMFITMGTDDMLCPDEKLFVAKAKENGCVVEDVTGEGLIHVWSILPIPEAEAVQKRIFAWLKSPVPSLD